MRLTRGILFALILHTMGNFHHHLTEAGEQNQCDLGDEEFGVFERTFVNILDGSFEGYSQDLGRFMKHHRCAGREEQDILAEGRKAVSFLETEYGIDLSSVTDQDLLDGSVTIAGGKMVFHPFAFKSNTKYRVIAEISKCGRPYLFRNAPISHAGWVVDVKDTVTLSGPRFNGTLERFCAISTGEYIAVTRSSRHRNGKLVFRYKARYPVWIFRSRYVVIDLEMYSPRFGKGQSYAVFERIPNGLNGREVITFPSGN